tara:strand:+ start:201 stop:749 length:549 start_codon:yes stop_codon:yes gene_type:complete
MEQIGYTDMREGDIRFVRYTWVENFRTSHYAGVIPMGDYFRIYHRIIRKLMDRDGVAIKIAYNPQHPTQIYGFCCYEDGFDIPVLHYIYVKEDFRQLPAKDDSFKAGIATLLLKECSINPELPFYYTFKTGAWARLVKWGGPFSGGVFRPLLARFDKDDAVSHMKSKSKKQIPHQKENQKCA